jgi:carboxypeptidase Taq
VSQTPAYDALVAHHRRIHDLEHLQAVATWDRLTHMPPAGAPARAAAQAALAVLIKQLQAEPAMARQFKAAAQEPLQGDAALDFARMQQARRIEEAIPQALAERRELATGAAMQAWGRARQDNAWAPFAAAWSPLVTVAREQAARLGDALELRPMDALLERWEPGLRMARVTPLFAQVQAWLPPLLGRALAAQAERPAAAQPVGPFPALAQQRLCERVMSLLGFDFEAGRLDTTQHPFTGGVPEDVRLATRFDEADFLPALLGTIHETGHARYQQNLPRAWLGQPLAGPHSAALHEGQALILRTPAGPRARLLRSPGAAAAAGLRRPSRRSSRTTCCGCCAASGPGASASRPTSSPTRCTSSCASRSSRPWWPARSRSTTCRPGGTSACSACWASTRKGPFSQGPLQDPHWVQGMFGYFPAYLLGAMVAAQAFAALRRDVPDLDTQVAAGNCRALGDWLAPRFWQQGARHDLDPMMLHATGEPLSDTALRHHLEQRHGCSD